MSSNSIRVSAELFSAATAQGKVFTRSAAQQLEHWAKLGLALEEAGLAVQDVPFLLAEQIPIGGDSALWAFKRSRQKRDAEMVSSGAIKPSQLSWFSGGVAKSATLADSPY